MYFAFGFVLLPTIALTSPMLDELLNYPADTTGYMAIPRSIALVGALILTGRVPARIDNRLLVVGGMALVVYANWRMLGYSPEMDWRPVIVAGVLQGAGLGILLPALTKTAFSTLDPTFRPEGTALFNLSRLYGSTIGIALVLIFFYDNTQAMHLALAKDLAPYRAAAHVAGSIAKPGLATLNDMITGQAAFVGVIDQFKVMMIAMLIVSPLVLFLRKPRPALATGARHDRAKQQARFDQCATDSEWRCFGCPRREIRADPPESSPRRRRPERLRGSESFWPVCSVSLSWRFSSCSASRGSRRCSTPSPRTTHT